MQLKSEIRVPVQKRSREKFETTLQAAETLILQQGLDQTSIPEIAKKTGLPRATIYQYFPDIYVLYAYLAERHMQNISALLETHHPAEQCSDWEQYITDLLKTNAGYYAAHPVARSLLLNGPFGISDLEAHKAKHQALSGLLKKALNASGTPHQFPDTPDVLILAIEIGFACFRYGYWYEGEINDAVLEEARTAIMGCLSRFVAER